MYSPSAEDFIKRAREENLISVYREISADLETPISIFSKIDTGEYAFLLENAEKGQTIGRYSLLGSDPSLVFKVKGKRVQIIKRDSQESYEVPDPLETLKKLITDYRVVKDENLPEFTGGAVGYLGYDMVRSFERLPDKNPDDLDLPDALFFFADTFLLFDHLKHKIKVVACTQVCGEPEVAYKGAVEKIEVLVKQLREPSKIVSELEDGGRKVEIKSNLTREEFERMVRMAKEYIEAGEARQTIVSQRLEAEIDVSPFNIYRALRGINPSPYMFYLKCGNMKLIGASPENLLKVKGRTVITRPVASTHPRGKDLQEDDQMALELCNSPKERSEHTMLSRLCMKELEEVCEKDSLKMDSEMEIEKYSHVMHFVSTISGRLREDKDSFDLLYICFPSATITGVPKRRAMEIIEEIEPVKRGPYTGSVGVLSFSGGLDLGIIVRTIIVKGNQAYIPVGCGIVADSIPEREYQETMHKAQAQIKAIEIA
jgi:anthranilate synthase component 1